MRSHFAVLVKQARDRNLARAASAHAFALRLVHVMSKATDESFVNFSFARKLLKLRSA
jgi:hypothetical protein